MHFTCTSVVFRLRSTTCSTSQREQRTMLSFRPVALWETCAVFPCVFIRKPWKTHGLHLLCQTQSALPYRCVHFTSQSSPFCDFKARSQEEAADRGWTFIFAFHRSRVRASAERRLPQPHFEVSPQSRQCLHSSSTLQPAALHALHTSACYTPRMLSKPQITHTSSHVVVSCYPARGCSSGCRPVVVHTSKHPRASN